MPQLNIFNEQLTIGFNLLKRVLNEASKHPCVTDTHLQIPPIDIQVYSSSYFQKVLILRSLSKVFFIHETTALNALCFLKRCLLFTIYEKKKMMQESRYFFTSWHCSFSTILSLFFFINSNQTIHLYKYFLIMHVCMITVSWRPVNRPECCLAVLLQT